MFMFKERQQYAQVASEEQPDTRKSQFLYKNTIRCVLLGVASAVCLLIGLVVLVYHGWRPGSEHERTTDCGTTLAEFEANGCVFDVLSYTWMPPRCVDRATSGEFESWLSDSRRISGPWPFFKEASKGLPLAGSRITSAFEFGQHWEMGIWSTREEHLAHCMFMLLHASRVAFGEAPRLSADSYPHANHCFHAIWKGLNGTWNISEDTLVNQKITIGATSC